MVVLSSLQDPKLIALLRQGAVGILPTDTIYGLVARASDPEAAAALYKLKSREHKPGTVIAASTEQLVELGLDPAHVDKVKHLWPNPLSIVLPAPAALDYLDQEVGSLAVRIPEDEAVQALLTKTGPLLTSSANHPGEAPADTMAMAAALFGDNAAFYVDGGDRSGIPPSTVARLETNGRLTVLRAGAVTIDERTEKTQ